MKRVYVYCVISICCLFLTVFLISINASNPENVNYMIITQGTINSNCYQCAYASDVSNGNPPTTTVDVESSINAFVTVAGKGIYLYNVQSTIYNDNDPSWIFNMMKPVIQAGLCQGIMVDFWPIASDTALNDSTTIAAIAAGTWNSYFTTFADEAKAFGYPIYLRIGAEMNINQGSTTWSGVASFGENASTFVLAWQYVYDVFQSQNAKNVYFVWNPNYNSNGPNDLTAYYPGNRYVNWVGIDIYQQTASSDNIPSMINEIYSTYSSQKPIMIAEWGYGSSYTDAQRATWMNNFFGVVSANPDIQMLCYEYSYPTAFTSATLPLTTATYQSDIANFRYIA